MKCRREKKVTIKIYETDLSTILKREKSNFERQKCQPIKTMCKYQVRLERERERANDVEIANICIEKMLRITNVRYWICMFNNLLCFVGTMIQKTRNAKANLLCKMKIPKAEMAKICTDSTEPFHSLVLSLVLLLLLPIDACVSVYLCEPGIMDRKWNYVFA